MNNVTIEDNRYWVRVNDSYSFPILFGDVLISIKHKYAAQIYDGTKLYELRHNKPNFKPGTMMWVYEPLPVGKITGIIEFRACIMAAPWLIWQRFKDHLGVTREEFCRYYDHRDTAYAWELAGRVKLDEPITLADIGLSRPPQSYQYLNLAPSNPQNR